MNEFNHRILALLRVKQQREIPEKFRPEWLLIKQRKNAMIKFIHMN